MFWPWLLFGCAVTAIGLHEKVAPGSPKLALIFAIHIIAMQGIKYIGLPQYAVLFFACYSIMALAAALWFDEIAAFTLAAIAIVYLVFAFGFISRHTSGIIADLGFVVAMVIGMINGPSEGIRSSFHNIFGSRPDNALLHLPTNIEAHPANLDED